MASRNGKEEQGKKVVRLRHEQEGIRMDITLTPMSDAEEQTFDATSQSVLTAWLRQALHSTEDSNERQ